ncbi:hypothetical protein COL154_002790 [Colletotrichum chrysophilum]|nr:hypothetical protein KNSL1_001888 [Colletotrichum chrysophilum]KAJ0368043.1 hypothetical protein COL154_002790 [Colletotrichum chrysophilum]
MAVLNLSVGGSPAEIGLRAVLLLVIFSVGYTLVQLVQVRLLFWRLKRQGVPMMPHSLLFGHIPVITKITSGLPKDIHTNYFSQLIYQNWPTLFPGRKTCPPIIYVDLWPMGPPMCFTIEPEVAWQTGSADLPRAHKEFVKPLTENLDIASLEGAEWKVWRARFNPAFSPKNIVSLVPGIIKDVETFAGIFRKNAGKDGKWGEVFTLEDLATNLTMDVIGRAALGIELHEQTDGPSKLKVALMDQIAQCRLRFSIIDKIWSVDPVRQWRIARNKAALRDELYQPIMRCLERKGDGESKTLVDQAMKPLKGLIAEKALPPDEGFIESVMAQLKIFMFAGHDTTATVICWTIHVLAKHPAILDKVRAEHDEVFGKDPSKLKERLMESPHLLNSLPYTAGVIKETMRLYPVIPPLRKGSPDYQIKDKETGMALPTEHFDLWDGIRSTSREEKVWPRAEEVIPERWLTTNPDDPLYPTKGAWRGFGNGPRVCIGLELANTEVRMAVAFLAREFDIDCAWDEWDAAR